MCLTIKKVMHKSIQLHRSGFTIVELLIVIVVIGILAAIVIVAYNGIQSNASDTVVKSDLASAKKKIEQYKIMNSEYPSGSGMLVGDYKLAISSGSYNTSNNRYNLLYCLPTSGSRDSYAYLVIAKSGKVFYITNTDGVTEYVGSANWVTDSASAICSSVLPSSSNAGGVGYSRVDTTSGPWRGWTGIPN